MKQPIQIQIDGPRTPVLKSPFPRSTSALILITFALAWFAFSPAARAVYPSPGGGYPGNNTAEGDNALLSLATGFQNTAIGSNALLSLATGFNNTAIGSIALSINTSGSNNIALGSGAGSLLTTGNNNIDIGNPGVSDENNTIRIGTAGTQTAAYIAGIAGVSVTNGNPVVVDANGQLGTIPLASL